MSKLSKVKNILPSSRIRTRQSASLPDIREEPIIADQIILRPPSVSMSSSDTSPVNTSINSAEVYASLRIPDAIKFLPGYNGDSKLLSDFINNV